MKILIIRTFPSILDPNGYNIQEIGFAKALVRCGVLCDVILYNGKNADREEIIEVRDGEKTIGTVKVFLRHGFGILKNGFFPGLDRIVKDYDLLQVHEYDQISSWKYYAWYKKKPVVIYHGPYFDEFNKGYNFKCRVFDNLFLRLKHNRDTLCFTKSRAAAKFLNSKGFKRTVPIGVGLNTDNFSGGAVVKAEGKDTWDMVYIGKIEPRRNSMLLLDIIEEVHRKQSNIHMTVVGTGEKEYFDAWYEKAKPLIESGVLSYIDKMEQSRLKGLYATSDVMVFPSNYEIFGMVLLEAMYFDLPVISSDNGGSDTLIENGKNGIVVDSFNRDTWVDAILELYNNRDKYNEIKRALVETDHSTYTWDGIARKYLRELGLN